MNKLFITFTALLALVIGGGCFHDAEDYQELPDVSTLAERSAMSPEELATRKAILAKIASEPPPPYRIDSGDKFSLRVYDNIELNVDDVTVTPDGYLSFLLVGPQKVGGMTLQEATALLEQLYAQYIKYPKVSLMLRQMNSQTATIGGKVTHPGKFTIGDGTRLADLIAMAWNSPTQMFDGQSVDMGDWESSIFVRNGEAIPVDFNAAMQGDPTNNLLLHDGDYVYVTTRGDKIISVIGEVGEPRVMLWNAGLGLIEVIANSKGLAPEHWSNALVIRGGLHNPAIYRINIDDILAGKSKNVALHPGDIVYVPKDNFDEYNVYVKKLMPTAQLLNMLLTPAAWAFGR